MSRAERSPNGRPQRKKRLRGATDTGVWQEVFCPVCHEGRVLITRSDVLGAQEMSGLAADILSTLAEEYFVTVADLVGERRFRRLIEPRFRAYWQMRTELGMSLASIANVMNRDHSSILHGLNQMSADGTYPINEGSQSWEKAHPWR